jgi:hypothetical protein
VPQVRPSVGLTWDHCTRQLQLWESSDHSPVQPVRRLLLHLVAYGSTNKYRPVSRSKASENTAKRPTLEVYWGSAIRTLPTLVTLVFSAC